MLFHNISKILEIIKENFSAKSTSFAHESSRDNVVHSVYTLRFLFCCLLLSHMEFQILGEPRRFGTEAENTFREFRGVGKEEVPHDR
jgi:hypothetical protein